MSCEVHHLLSGGQRRGHQFTIGLESWHHRGETGGEFGGCIAGMTRAHGPSLRHNSKAFHERYGTDEELLMVQDSMIRIVESARRRNEYLPPDEIARLIRMLHREIVRHRAPNANCVKARQ